jgi:hypothetical protein
VGKYLAIHSVLSESTPSGSYQDMRNRFAHQHTHYRRLVGFDELIRGLTYMVKKLEDTLDSKLAARAGQTAVRITDSSAPQSGFGRRRRLRRRSAGGCPA